MASSGYMHVKLRIWLPSGLVYVYIVAVQCDKKLFRKETPLRLVLSDCILGRPIKFLHALGSECNSVPIGCYYCFCNYCLGLC